MRRRNLKLFAAGCNLLFLMPFICYVCGILFLAGFRDWRQSEKQRANMLNDSYLFAIDLQRLFGDEWESSPVLISDDQTDVLDWNPEVAGSAKWLLTNPKLEHAFVSYQVFTFLSPQAATWVFELYLALFGSGSHLLLHSRHIADPSVTPVESESSYEVQCWEAVDIPGPYVRCTSTFLSGNHIAQLTSVSVPGRSFFAETMPAVVAAIDATLSGRIAPEDL